MLKTMSLGEMKQYNILDQLIDNSLDINRPV